MTDFINFLENTEVPENTILVSMDVTSLYTNIPQEVGISMVCNAYKCFHEYKPIPTHLLRKIFSKYMEPLWELKWQYLLPTW